MSKIRIAENLSLPIEAITNTFAIFGIRGSGKSNLGAVMAEGIIKAGQPICIIDPTGAWYGLKSSRDGKTAGLPVYVFGGEHADIPLEATAGEVLANFVVERRVPTILDLKLMRKHEQIKFVLTFAEVLFHRNREPLMVMIDEVARFGPQIIKDKSPDAARCLGAIEDLATLGRNRGLGVTLIAQRPAPVSTTLRTQVENLICLRTIGKHDRKALDEWVEAKGSQAERDQMMKDLAELPDGVGYFWSPGWLHRFSKEHFLRRETFDSGATPKIGQKPIVPKAFAEIDKHALSAEIQSTIERVKADNPAELRKLLAAAHVTISQLEKYKAKSGALKPDGDRSSSGGKEQYQRGYEAGFKTAGESFSQLQAERLKRIRGLGRETKDLNGQLEKHLLKAVEDLGLAAQKHKKMVQLAEAAGAELLEPVTLGPSGVDNLKNLPRAMPAASDHGRPAANVHISRRADIPPAANGNLSGPEQRVVDALAELESLGIENPARVQVAFMANYTNLNSKGFTNAIGALRTAGRIDYPGSGTISLTDAGREVARTFDTPRTTKELQDRLITMLGGTNGRILRVLLDAHPEALERNALGAAAGYTNLNSKGFTNAIGRLRTLGLIDYPERGMVKATSLLFLEAGAGA